MSFSCSACITAHFIQPLNILPRPVTKPDLQMPKQPLNLCGIFGVKKGQSGDECAICIREPAIAVCLNNARRPQTKTDLCLPRVALRSLRSGCPHRASRTCFSFRSLWACRACCPGVSLWTLWTCISRQTGLSPLSPVTFRPLRACRTSITCRSPFAGCPDRAGVTALSLITLRPLRTRGPLFPLWPGRSHHGGDSVYGLFRRYPALFR
ncbi:hypothetical protein ECTW09109_3160 [Escherichia coli TW09109]|nr:hypothetical protein ECTW09109_3160 [Escherichia coli TW09109]